MAARSILGAAVLSCVLMACSSHPTEVQKRQSQMLNPTVRVELKQGSGSGTVIHSSDKGTYIVTNHHVAGEKANTVQVRFWLLNSKGETALSVLRDAEVVASDADKDLALLKLADSEFRAEAVAVIASDDELLQPTEEVFVCGSALGLRAHCTTGLLSLAETQLQGRTHIAMSAPTIFGNSGGGLWHRSASGRFEYIGTARAIAMVGFGSPVMTTAYAVPNKALREFLKESGNGGLI